jgi:hypothetical protein
MAMHAILDHPSRKANLVIFRGYPCSIEEMPSVPLLVPRNKSMLESIDHSKRHHSLQQSHQF